MSSWMLYGAYGFTGKLIIEEALARGHKPLLAGRSAEKLIPLADQYDLDWMDVALDDDEQLRDAVAGVDAVLHAAGPFIHTSEPMIQACLAGQSHYLDITGEIPVFLTTFSYDDHAREQGVALISGVGFDIVPTDCMAAYISAEMPDAIQIDLAFRSTSGASAGTTKTMLELFSSLPKGSLVRQEGKLVDIPMGAGQTTITFSDGKQRNVVPIPWGDLATAEISTGVNNITTSLALQLPPGFTLTRPLMARLLDIDPVRSLAKRGVDAFVSGPDEETRGSARAFVYARGTNEAGAWREAWLETGEVYDFTAKSSVRAVERLLAEPKSGALTPSLAFGADFVLDIPGVHRFDQIDVT